MERALAAAGRLGARACVIRARPPALARDAPGVALMTTAGAAVHRVPQSLPVHARGRRAAVGSENLLRLRYEAPACAARRHGAAELA
jgi:hypothetical protein